MSNIVPRNAAANLQGMFERIIGQRPSGLSYDAAMKHAKATGNVLRSGGEAAVVGSLLGVINASRADGLDIRTPVTNKVGLPIDGMAAFTCGLIAIAAAQEPYSVDFANASAAAAAIFSFRKTNDLVAQMRSGATPGGGAQVPGRISKATFGGDVKWGNSFPHADRGEDPIVVAGKRL